MTSSEGQFEAVESVLLQDRRKSIFEQTNWKSCGSTVRCCRRTHTVHCISI